MWPPNQSAASSSKDDPTYPDSGPKKKLRAACDRCHHAKTKCSGGKPCSSCAASGQRCNYSETTRTGRPKGARNKKTLAQKEREQTEASSSCGNSARDQHPSLESSGSGYQLQVPVTSSYSQPGQPFTNQRLQDFDTMLLDAASNDGFGEDMSHSIDWSRLGEYLNYNTGAFMPTGGGLLSSASESTEPRQAPLLLPVDPAQRSQYSVGSRSGIGSSSTSGTDEVTMALRSTVLNTQVRSATGEHDDLFLNPHTWTSAHSPLHRTSSSSSMQMREPRPTSCRCLEQHTELLRNLKSLLQGQTMLDNVLTAVQQALWPWQNLIQCSAYVHDDDHSILQLSLMSMRVLLRHLQQICFGNGASPSGHVTPEQSTLDLGMFSTGGYQPTQNEQKHITDLLIFHALRKIKFVLNALKTKFVQSRGAGGFEGYSAAGDADQTSPISGDPDADSIPPLFENLERGVAAIFNAVRTRAKASGAMQD